jgi:hypothetical protein
MENSVDQHVLKVLEAKLWRILDELGSDKWSDVLESAGRKVEDLYTEAILRPEQLEERTLEVAQQTREDVLSSESLRSLLISEIPTVPHSADGASTWIARAAEAYGKYMSTNGESALERLPESVPGESVPTIHSDTQGIWSLWEVRPHGPARLRDCLALFLTEERTLRPDLAERVWLRLADGVEVRDGPPLPSDVWDELQRLARDFGYSACASLAPVETWKSPWLVLRLVIRATP